MDNVVINGYIDSSRNAVFNIIDSLVRSIMQFLKKDVLIVQTPIIMNSTFTVINMLCCI